jgi:aspartokinase-like uncharacterized kinase
MMWVVKLGGSLADDPLLPDWLAMLAEEGAGRVAVVPGGGAFADAGRAAQARWQLDDVAAHNIAVFGMCQFAHVLHGLCPRLRLVAASGEIPPVLRAGEAVLWLPLELLRARPDELTNWDTTSDSLALWLAARLGAERAVLVKSCAIPPGADWASLAGCAIVDRAFPRWAGRVQCPIELASRDALESMRSWLHAPR